MSHVGIAPLNPSPGLIMVVDGCAPPRAKARHNEVNLVARDESVDCPILAYALLADSPKMRWQTRRAEARSRKVLDPTAKTRASLCLSLAGCSSARTQPWPSLGRRCSCARMATSSFRCSMQPGSPAPMTSS